MKEYNARYFDKEIDLEKVKDAMLEFFNWENEDKYRPQVRFNLSFCKSFFEVNIETDEKDIRAVCKNTNEPCYEDSCMEIFFAPFGKDKGYINIECNALGTYLSEYGLGKYDRVYLNTITSLEPVINAKVRNDGWSVNIKVNYELIEEVFGIPFNAADSNFFANVYKCGDKTIHPHYVSFTQMGDLPPGFHNPECFAKINIIQ